MLAEDADAAVVADDERRGQMIEAFIVPAAGYELGVDVTAEGDRAVVRLTYTCVGSAIPGRMDDIGASLVRLDGWLFHLSNVLVGVAVLVAVFPYALPGSVSLDLLVARVDPFCILAPPSVAYAC